MINNHAINSRLLEEVATHRAGWTGSNNQDINLLHLFLNVSRFILASKSHLMTLG